MCKIRRKKDFGQDSIVEDKTMVRRKDMYDIINEEMSISADDHESLFRWFATQGHEVRLDILVKFAQKILGASSNQNISDKDIYTFFLKLVYENGWKVSQKICSKNLIRPDELMLANRNEISRALTYVKKCRKKERYNKIHANTKLILEMRKEGMTYKEISLYFKNVKKIKVSISTISNIINGAKKGKDSDAHK